MGGGGEGGTEGGVSRAPNEVNNEQQHTHITIIKSLPHGHFRIVSSLCSCESKK